MQRYFVASTKTWLVAAALFAFALPVFAQEGGSNSSPGTDGRLFFLDIRGRVYSANPDGSDLKVLLEFLKGSPDGIAVDEEAGMIYWSNMGRASDDDGSIERADLNGNHYKIVVPPGGTHTAKQLKLDKKNGKLYWSDREGMRVMRSNVDGSKIETLVEVGSGDARARGRHQLVCRPRRRRRRRQGVLDAEGAGQWVHRQHPPRESRDSRRGRRPRTGKTSRSCSRACRSRSTSTWISIGR